MTDRIGGMTISSNTAALVVLARDGDGQLWTVNSARTFTIGPHPIDCPFPIILDAAAFARNARNALGVPDANHLREAGWDVRPPLWRDGRAANPSDDEISEAWDRLGPWRGFNSNAPDAVYRAADLAAWGATHSTTAKPPAAWTFAPPAGPFAGSLHTVKSHPELGTRAVERAMGVTAAEHRGDEWAEQRRADARALDDFARHETAARHALNAAGVPQDGPDGPLDVAERIALLAAERDASDAALLEVWRSWSGGETVVGVMYAARDLLVGRGLIKAKGE